MTERDIPERVGQPACSRCIAGDEATERVGRGGLWHWNEGDVWSTCGADPLAERAGASRQEEPAMFVCSFCQRGDYCPTAPHYAAPPAPETPPRPDLASVAELIMSGAKDHSGGYCHSHPRECSWFEDIMAILQKVRAAQPNAESAAVQKCEGIPDIWDGRDWGAQHCDGCGAAQALRERCEGLEKAGKALADHAEEAVTWATASEGMTPEPGDEWSFNALQLIAAVRRAALSGGGGPSK